MLRQEEELGSGYINPRFLDLNTVGVTWSNSHPDHREKSPRYPLERRLGGPQSRSGPFRENKILEPISPFTIFIEII
jgi:hypothetical protein